MPTLGTGNLKFPWSVASSILTEEVIAFSQRYASSPLRDIRVIVFEKDQKSIQEFQNDIAQVQRQHGIRGTLSRSVSPVNAFGGQGKLVLALTITVSFPLFSFRCELLGQSLS